MFSKTRIPVSIQCAVALSLLAAVCIRAQDASPTQSAPATGPSAPPFSVAIVGDGSSAAGTRLSLDSLKGSAVVLEFWATWCSGCIAQIPHLNELVEKFKGQPIVFLSITDEDPPVVSRFLKRRSIAGLVGIDADIFKAYDVLGRPGTALIDVQGRLVEICPPGEVTEEKLRMLISGKLEPRPQVKFRILPIGLEADAPPPVFHVVIRPAMPAKAVGFSPGSTKRVGSNLQGYGYTIRRMLARAYGFYPDTRIIAPEWCEGSLFDFSVPTADEDGQSLRLALETAFGIRGHRENREVDVYVLQNAMAPVSLRQDEFGWSVEDLARQLERLAGRPVFIASGLSGRYAGSLPEAQDLGPMRVKIRSEFGLELKEERRDVPLLIVEATGQ